MKNQKTSQLQTILTAVFVGALLISNIIAGKQLQLPFGITMTGAVIVFPITYILSDLFSEVYGYRWSRLTCYLAFAINIFMAIVFAIAIETPAPGYWQNQEAFAIVLGNTPRILFASLTAFVAGDFINDRVFRRMKAKHPDSHKCFGARSIVSSIAGAIVDSAIFIPIAFIGMMPLDVLIIMGITQVCLKLLYELLVLPLNRYVTIKVSEHERG
jgi:uncharacterized integral membrane protein (TIGR00697 family)